MSRQVDDEPASARRYATAGVCAAALIVLYVAAYFALVGRGRLSISLPEKGSSAPRRYVKVPPAYAIPGNVVRAVFAPIHFVDSKVRCHHWHVPDRP